MIDFRFYLTELFDKRIKLNAHSNNTHFTFLVRESGGRLESVPAMGKELDAWVEANEGMGGSTVYRYEVGFMPIRFVEGYNEFFLFYGSEYGISEDMDEVKELYFERQEVVLTLVKNRPRPVNSDPSKYSRYYWAAANAEFGSGDDLNWLGAGEAASVLATVVEAAKRYVKRHKPSGIIVGTKKEANPARGRIYRALARRAAAAIGGKVYDLAIGRDEMAAPTMIWLDKKRDPFKGRA